MVPRKIAMKLEIFEGVQSNSKKKKQESNG